MSKSGPLFPRNESYSSSLASVLTMLKLDPEATPGQSALTPLPLADDGIATAGADDGTKRESNAAADVDVDISTHFSFDGSLPDDSEDGMFGF